MQVSVDRIGKDCLSDAMKLLIIGGTIFVGRTITEVALARGHTVTMLNRGKTKSAIPAGVEHIQADRDIDLSALADRSWDAVIDTCAYYPRQVRQLLKVLKSTNHYTLISSVSAYADLAANRINEDSALSPPAGDEVDIVDHKTYGPLKSACEQVATELAGGHSLIIRPGIIVGPYWVRRLAAAEKFIAPGDGTARLQLIDGRDLADWLVRMIEQRMTGIFNAVGPVEPLSFRQMVETGRAALQSKATPVWVPAERLIAAELDRGSLLPLWMPPTKSKFTNMFAIEGGKAWAAGLRLRPLDQTMVDVSADEAKRNAAVAIGLAHEREQELLREWQD